MQTTPHSIATGPLVPGWLKVSILAALVFLACWAGAISYWRTSDSTPATGDLVLYLLGLPAAILLAFWSGHKLIAQHAAAPSPAVPSAQTAAAAPKQASLLAIVATSLRLPHGASPEELSAAIADNKARADLDRELVDDDGFPVMAARSSDARDEALQEEITEWFSLSGMPDPHFSDEQWRALTLASAVAGDLASHAASQLGSSTDDQAMLQLVPILPAEWHADQRHGARMWLKHTAAQFGWPPAYITLAAEVAAETHDAAAATVFGRLALEAALPDVPLVAIVLACASNIGHECVAQWAAGGSLFTSSQPKGAIPGEGAAGLLLIDPRQAASISNAALAVLDPMEEGRRDSSADETRRTDPNLLGELAERALKRSGAAFSDVGMVIADTDHRSSRVLELMGHVAAAMPHLDDAADVVRVGVTCGTCGAVPFITSLVLAHHHVLEREAPVLAISNEDPYRRIAALIRPATARC